VGTRSFEIIKTCFSLNVSSVLHLIYLNLFLSSSVSVTAFFIHGFGIVFQPYYYVLTFKLYLHLLKWAKNVCASDMLRVFPPKSLQLKKPFALRPWADSEENVGNLLMVKI